MENSNHIRYISTVRYDIGAKLNYEIELQTSQSQGIFLAKKYSKKISIKYSDFQENESGKYCKGQ